jgi:hypothetical protein
MLEQLVELLPNLLPHLWGSPAAGGEGAFPEEFGSSFYRWPSENAPPARFAGHLPMNGEARLAADLGHRLRRLDEARLADVVALFLLPDRRFDDARHRVV